MNDEAEPVEVARVVYGTCQADGVLRFVPRDVAEDVAQVHVALAERTWADFRRELPLRRWAEVVAWYEDDELPDDDVLLDDAPPVGAEDGSWPTLPSDASWIPDEVLAVGRFVATALDGALFGCLEEREAEIVLAFLHEGFELARDDGLVETACGLNGLL